MSVRILADMFGRWETFRLLAGLIAPEPHRVGLPASVPWEDLMAASSHHLVTPALAWSLRGADVPDDAAQYLDAVLDLNRARNQSLMTALSDCLHILNRGGITPLLLKGAASQADQLYPDPAIRILGDLDILAPAGRAEECHALLAANGFSPEGGTHYGSAHHHLRPLRHARTGMFVEMHRFAGGRDYAALMPAAAIWRDATQVDVLGYRACLSAPTERFCHALVHTLLQDRHLRSGTMTLRQMLELAVLTERFRETIDWAGLAARFRAAGHFAVLQQGCESVQRLFGLEQVTQIEPCTQDPLAPFREKLQRRLPSPSRILLRHVEAIRARPSRLLDYLRPAKLPGRARRLLRYFGTARWTP